MKISQKDIEEIRQSTKNGVRFHVKYYDSANGGGARALLWHYDGRKIAHAGGCGYDRAGTLLGDVMALLYPDELQKLAEKDNTSEHYGLRLSKQTGKFIIDGACGVRSMETIAEALGFKVEHFSTGKDKSVFILTRKG